MSNYYAKAIQVLVDHKTDFRALVYEIAKVNPKAVVTASERFSVGFGWQRECAALMASGAKAKAVLRCRELTGLGLADAKNAVESLES